LLRPAGKGLMCPAVGIRDWPSLQRRDAQDDLSRGADPEFLKKQFRAPGA
jgi:hypothetical protein